MSHFSQSLRLLVSEPRIICGDLFQETNIWHCVNDQDVFLPEYTPAFSLQIGMSSQSVCRQSRPLEGVHLKAVAVKRTNTNLVSVTVRV